MLAAVEETDRAPTQLSAQLLLILHNAARLLLHAARHVAAEALEVIQPDIRRNGKVEVMSILQVLEGIYRIEVEEQLLDPTVSLPLLEDQAAPLNHDIEILLVADFNTLKASHRVRVRKDLEYIRPGRISGCDLRRTCLSSCCSFPSAPSALCRRKPFEHFLHHGRSHPELCGVRSAPSQGCSASARSAPLWRLGGNTGPQRSKVRNQSRAQCSTALLLRKP